jgi:cytochrome c oxidase cbb3-type subunit 4
VTGILQGLLTLLLMALFIGIVWWAYGKKQKKHFDEAANLPFADEESARRGKQPHEGEKQ